MVGSTWHSKANSASADATHLVAEAAVSSVALSDAANPSTGTAAVMMMSAFITVRSSLVPLIEGLCARQ